MLDHFVRPRALVGALTALAVLALAAAACTSEAAPTPPSEPTTTTEAAPSASAAVTSIALATPEPASTPGADDIHGKASSAAIGDPRPAPELADLLRSDGAPFDLADYAGAPTLLFFGYTRCPDVCPATIAEIMGVFEEIPDSQAVFISVDPERDTVKHLASWVDWFPDGFEAVTGSPGAIRRAADNYGVRYARVETTSTAGYTMSHTADLYLIDADGQLLKAYPFGTPSETIVADLVTLGAS